MNKIINAINKELKKLIKTFKKIENRCLCSKCCKRNNNIKNSYSQLLDNKEV